MKKEPLAARLLAFLVTVVAAALLINLWMVLLTVNAAVIDRAARKINEMFCAFKLTTQCKPECRTISCKNRK